MLLNGDYVADAIGFGTVVKKTESAHIEFSADPITAGPFMIRHEVGTAVVMPMRIEDAEEHQEVAGASSEPDTYAHDLPGFADAMGALTSAMEEGDTITISGGGKASTHQKRQGSMRRIDEQV